MDELVFYDVDTQNDFMNEDGALYVPGAEGIKENLRKLTQYAKEKGIRVVASVDRHFGTLAFKDREGELQKWGGPFPDHCMDGMGGQLKIPETEMENPAIIENKTYEEGELEKRLNGRREVLLEKQSYDAFTNGNLAKLLEGVKRAVVYGVATDYCVKAAVLGMLKRGIEVSLVEDAISGVDIKLGDSKRAVDAMVKSGARLVKTEEVLGGAAKREYRNPLTAVDAIIRHREGIVLIKRRNAPIGWALPGGFVEYGESLEEAVVREAEEETGLSITLVRQLHTYSDPNRDPRQHVISTAYVADGAGGELRGMDDAKEARVFGLDELPKLVLGHDSMLKDYLKWAKEVER